jgi:hypothetical protein
VALTHVLQPWLQAEHAPVVLLKYISLQVVHTVALLHTSQLVPHCSQTFPDRKYPVSQAVHVSDLEHVLQLFNKPARTTLKVSMASVTRNIM